MSKAPAKKGLERRRKPRGKASTAPAKRKASPKMSPQMGAQRTGQAGHAKKKSQPAVEQELCKNCGKVLDGKGRALFVEEEVGRVFCSEPCIAGFFTPEIARLEKEYFRRLSPDDLSGDEREKLAHLRWVTLQEPDEVWREKTLSGDYRYTLISEFQPGTQRVWCVCICLFLRGEPSFLYLAFPTRNAAMASSYRRGERVQWERSRDAIAHEAATAKREKASEADYDEAEENAAAGADSELKSDRLADAWTADETFLARLGQERSGDDISTEDFGLYQSCMEETLQEPDEVWSIRPGGEESLALYHFIRHYPDESPGIWYVIVARETEDEEQIEILDAFPTKDPGLVERYRTGEQEVGATSSRPATARVVH